MVAPATTTALVEVGPVLDAPCHFLYKKESQQPSGSFKLRGLSKLIATSIDEAKQLGKENIHVYSSSGGNAGIAAAYASNHHGVPCTIVLPTTAKQYALDTLKDLGATVIVHGAHWGETDRYLKETVITQVPASEFPVYCHPFDDPEVWSGHADMIDELPAQLAQKGIDPAKVKGVVCSCGGGGLYNGVVEGLRRNKELAHVPVLVVETTQADCFRRSVAAGRPIVMDKVVTMSTSLGSPYITEKTWENYQLHKTTVAAMDDMEAVDATVAYYDKFGGLVEPACGATVAVSMKRTDLLESFGPLQKDDAVVFIVCGGRTVNDETLSSYRELLAKETST